ncbi:hypothetical protein ABE82_26180 (plasmid) [Paenibacillus peoriae]|uniref:hypothetical protein n=1 Tax=Paenibacillus peoriae TaxID=59893 RepID=UPI00071F7878|nr:hypothetical protein [Paenibacillus peoriae]ALS09910.1 hypothetical protein ABE82_26180 [Paenibacillus peoriae]
MENDSNQVEPNEKKHFTPEDALARFKTYPIISAIGPSGAGKTQLLNVVVNEVSSSVLKVGVGEKNQTTLIPTNFILDSRIERDQQFAFQLHTELFHKKQVSGMLIESLQELFSKSGYSTEETVENMDTNWLKEILEPNKGAYHLGVLQEQIDVEELQRVVTPILEQIEEGDGKSFIDLAKEKKSESTLQGIKMKTVRKHLFEELWEQFQSTSPMFIQWIDNIGKVLWKKLLTTLHLENSTHQPGDVIEISGEFTGNEEDPYAQILNSLYDPSEPYSLMIDEIYFACRPNQELMNNLDNERNREKAIFRLCLRDTIGVTQTGTDLATIRTGLETCSTYKADMLLVLLNLEERDDVLKTLCGEIEAFRKRNDKQKMAIKLLFTKADRAIESKIVTKMTGLKLSDDIFNRYIGKALQDLGTDVEQLSELVPDCEATWLSLRYWETGSDRIQKAIKENPNIDMFSFFGSTEDPFKPDGIYKLLGKYVEEIMNSILPKGMDKACRLTVDDPNNPVITLDLKHEKLTSMLQNMQFLLTQDKAKVNSYLLPKRPINGYRISPWSVNTWWWYLSKGIGYQSNSRSGKYLNFNINMRSLLRNVLKQSLNSIENLYENNAIETKAENLRLFLDEFEVLLKALNTTADQMALAFAGLNPAVLDEMTRYNKYVQILHYKLREYFQDTNRQEQIINRVSYQLSYENPFVKSRITKAYFEQYSHDLSMRKVLHEYKAIFESQEFGDIVTTEIGATMTDMVNKLVIPI